MENLTPKQIRETCAAVVAGMERDIGPQVIFDLLLAIDRHQGWFTEIVCSRGEVDRAMMERHGSFDGEMWEKVKNTDAWKKWRLHSESLKEKYLANAIDEVFYKGLD